MVYRVVCTEGIPPGYSREAYIPPGYQGGLPTYNQEGLPTYNQEGLPTLGERLKPLRREGVSLRREA